MPSSISNHDAELAHFFTDVVDLRDAFSASVAAPVTGVQLNASTKRLLVIHGVGGVGKSSLLRMFRLHCSLSPRLFTLQGNQHHARMWGVYITEDTE